ncbi:MAG: sulfate permease [Anaerolineae bacterium]|nr:sulfate permease [Candidatus Roseilinea sp.]MDW8448467.1 sulfate permease [Anaerolineae bacterium]
MPDKPSFVQRYVPILRWLPAYRRADLPQDLIAGVITAIMLVPQSMAYAQLGGLPPQVGLYATILPIAAYAILGTSGQLAVGPAAITSLAVLAGVGALAAPGTPRYLELVLALTLMVGIIKVALGIFRLGTVLNFVSAPVLSGFMSAAALVIIASQLKHLLGFNVAGKAVHDQLYDAVTHINKTNPVTLAIALTSILILVLFKSRAVKASLGKLGVPPRLRTLIGSLSLLLVLVLGTLVTATFRLDVAAGVKTVGVIPAGLPPLALPNFSLTDAGLLAPTALTIVFISVVESISIAKALASKHRQRIDPDQELIGLGAANLMASFSGAYPVAGGLARSVVNNEAGAMTGLASLVTAAMMAATLVFLTPLFYYLPQAVLASIVVVAVAGLFDLREARRLYHLQRSDFLTWLATFAVTLVFNIEVGILAGMVLSLLLFLWHTSRPKVVEIGRIPGTYIFKNVAHHDTQTSESVVALRVDESLYFANARYLEDRVLEVVAARPAVRHMVLHCSAINSVDTTAIETLQSLHDELRDAGVELHLASLKEWVLSRLERAGFVAAIGRDHIHRSMDEALKAIEAQAAISDR